MAETQVQAGSQARSQGRVRVEPSPKRVRAYVHGVAVADSTNVKLVFENPSFPTYYFPTADVRTDLFVPSETTTHSPSRGDARYFTIRVDDVERVDAALQ